MFIWKYLDLDLDEVKKMHEAYLKILPNKFPYFYQNVLVEIKEFMGMELDTTVLIQSRPFSIGIIHTDHRARNDNILAINIPLINCQDSITEFWESDESNSKVTYTPNGSPYTMISRDKCTKISEFVLNKPVVFNTDIPHSVRNLSSKPRIAISLRFTKDPWNLTT